MPYELRPQEKFSVIETAPYFDKTMNKHRKRAFIFKPYYGSQSLGQIFELNEYENEFSIFHGLINNK